MIIAIYRDRKRAYKCESVRIATHHIIGTSMNVRRVSYWQYCEQQGANIPFATADTDIASYAPTARCHRHCYNTHKLLIKRPFNRVIGFITLVSVRTRRMHIVASPCSDPICDSPDFPHSNCIVRGYRSLDDYAISWWRAKFGCVFEIPFQQQENKRLYENGDTRLNMSPR